MPLTVKNDHVIEALFRWFFEEWMRRLNESHVGQEDAEPDPALLHRLPLVFGLKVEGGEFTVFSTLNPSSDGSMKQLLLLLKGKPVRSGRFSGETQREKVWVIYQNGRDTVIIFGRKILSTSTAAYRNGGHP